MADDKLELVLEQAWNPKEFSEFFMENFEPDLAIVVKEALRDQGYPETANYINIDFLLYTENKGTWEFWATEARKLIKDKTDAGIRNFFESSRDMYMYANNQNKLNFKVEFAEQPQEFIDRMPTREKVAGDLEAHWSEENLVEMVSEMSSPYEPVLEAIIEELKTNGFPEPEKIDLKTIDFSLQIKNKLDYNSWADIAIERYIYDTLQDFIKNQMETMYLQNPQYLNILVEINTELEEWKEEQEL